MQEPISDTQKTPARGSYLHRPEVLALAYLAVASLWIIGSDRLLHSLTDDIDQLTLLQQ